MRNHLTLLLAASCMFGFFPSAGRAQVWVVFTRSNPAYSSLLRGFQEQAKFQYEIVQLDEGPAPKTFRDSSASGQLPDAVVAVGSEAILACRNLDQNVALIYSMVLDPPALGRKNLSGVSMNISVARQLEKLRQLFPDRKRIGVIYAPAYSSRTIDQARQLAEKYHFTLLPIAIQESSEIPQALSKFTRDTIDLLWMMPDPITTGPVAIQKQIIHAKIEKLPLVGLSIYHVRTGALLAFSVNFQALGGQTAGFVRLSLAKDKLPQAEEPRQIIIYVNKTTQRELNIELQPTSEVQWIE